MNFQKLTQAKLAQALVAQATIINKGPTNIPGVGAPTSTAPLLLAANRKARVEKSSTQGFDQITAVTQGAINFQLKIMFNSEDLLQNFDAQTADGSIHAYMDPPKVQLLLGADNHAVIFHLNLASGSFEWRNSSNELVTQEFEKWRLAFRVNLNLRAIAKSKVPAEVTNRLLNYGEYGIQALLIDFTTANISAFDEALSNLPGLRVDGEPAVDTVARRADFVQYMTQYVKSLAANEGSHNILGYVPEFPNPSGTAAHAPTIPPTGLTFQNYPYIVDTLKPQDYVSDLYGSDPTRVATANNNMLIFLEMTNNRPLPTAGLTTTANWVIPGDGGKLTDGTIALSKKIFLDEYLLPRLIDLNKKFEIIAKETYCRVKNFIGYEVLLDARFGGYSSGQPNSFYAWRPTAETVVPAQPLAILKPAFSSFEAASKGPCFIWKWDTTTTKEDSDGYKSKLSCSSNNWLVIPKGSPNGRCSIYICGTSTVYGMFKPSAIDGGSTTVTGNWSAEIVFDTVIGGGLHVTCTANKISMNSSRNERWFEGPLGDIERGFQTLVSNLPLENTISELQELFNGNWQFFFPGGGDFFFKDPFFNYNGDLLLDLQYKGY